MGSVTKSDRKGIGNGECPAYECGLQEITTSTQNTCIYIDLGNVYNIRVSSSEHTQPHHFNAHTTT